MATPASAEKKVTAYLCVRGADAAIAFYTMAFGATEEFRLTDTSGKVGHAQIKIGASTVMLADEHPEYGVVAPPALGGSPVSLHIDVDDADVAYSRAVDAGPRRFVRRRTSSTACARRRSYVLSDTSGRSRIRSKKSRTTRCSAASPRC